MKIFATILPVALLQTALASSSGKGLEITPGYNVDMVYDKKAGQVTFTFVIPDQTWAGIVLGGKDMNNTNMIQVAADGDKSSFSDLYSTGGFQPSPADTSAVTGAFTQANGEVTFTLHRPLDPMDDQHYALKLDTLTQFALAVNSKSPDVAQPHDIIKPFKASISSKGVGLAAASTPTAGTKDAASLFTTLSLSVIAVAYTLF